MPKKEFVLKDGNAKYTMVLNDSGKVQQLRLDFLNRNVIDGEERISPKALKNFFESFMRAETEQFAELYRVLKQNDAESFAYADEVVCEMRDLYVKLNDMLS